MREVYIVIPTHNRPRLLAKTLTSLVDSDLTGVTAGVSAVVVENGSAVARELTEGYTLNGRPVEYIHVAEGNKSKALNLALEGVDPDTFVVFFDDDVILDRGGLRELIRAGLAFGSGHYYGGEVVSYYDEEPPAYLLRCAPESVSGFKLDISEPYENVSHLRSLFIGSNWALYAKDLKGIGGFDGNVGPGSANGMRGQEKDAMLRLVEAGHEPVYVRDAPVLHYVPRHVMTESWMLDRHFKTRLYAGGKRREPLILLKEVLRVPLAHASTLRARITGRPEHRFTASLLAAQSRGFFSGLGLQWPTAGL